MSQSKLSTHRLRSGSMSNRASSSPRPLTGSKAVTTIFLRSSVRSTTAHMLDGGLAQNEGPKPVGLLCKINSGVPPVMGTRKSGCCASEPGIECHTAMMTHHGSLEKACCRCHDCFLRIRVQRLLTNRITIATIQTDNDRFAVSGPI